MDGYLIAQMLYVAARLGIAEALADGPRDATSVARVVGAQPDALRRLLQGLASEGILDELPDARFSLTPLGTCRRDRQPA